MFWRPPNPFFQRRKRKGGGVNFSWRRRGVRPAHAFGTCSCASGDTKVRGNRLGRSRARELGRQALQRNRSNESGSRSQHGNMALARTQPRVSVPEPEWSEWSPRMIRMNHISPSRPQRSTLTQSIASRFVCARSLPVHRLSSKRARRRSSRSYRRAPSFEVCRDPPQPPVARARATRISAYVTQHAILSVIGREPDLRPFCSHACNFSDNRQNITLVGSARRRGRARAHHGRLSMPSPRETSHVISTCARHDNRDDDDDDHAASRNQDRDHCCHDLYNRTGPPTFLPKAHRARATSGTTPTRHSDGRGRRAAAQHTAVTVARRRGGAHDVAAAGDGAVTDHHHSAEQSRDRATFHVTVTRLRGWRRRRVTVAGAAHARGALVDSGGGVAFAAATCSPSGGGGSGGAFSTRHRA